MPDSIENTPANTVDAKDPGDETARRYRYQWTYAAVVCCMLLDDTQDATEVFCEHHEDILIGHADGSFSGLQVKTKSSDQPPWKTNDDGVQNACMRFVALESTFPGMFRCYKFLTNHSLYHASSGSSLEYVLQQVKATSGVGGLPSSVKRIVERIADRADCAADMAFQALSKVQASHDLPKLSDVTIRLQHTIAQTWQGASECSFERLELSSQLLFDECAHASSLSHADVLPGYLSAAVDPAGSERKARIEQKRFDRSRVLACLENGMNASALLVGTRESISGPGNGNQDLLRAKVNAGGFSATSLYSAINLRDKADHLAILWQSKYGVDRGLERYDHISSVVLADAAEAYEKAVYGGDPFGANMKRHLRERLIERRAQGSELFDCTNEHLEGFAYSLTAQCKVYWSIERPWETQ